MPDGFTLATPTRMGASNDGANRLQLFKTQVEGEILRTFEEEDKFTQFTRIRNITQGKSAIFPFVGNIGGGYHTPGTSLDTANRVLAAEKIISVDGQYIAWTWLTNLDEVMSAYDLRSEYTRELARALLRSYQRRLGRVLVRAARTDGALSAAALAADSGYLNVGASGATPAATVTAAVAGTGFRAYKSALNIGSTTTGALLLNSIWAATQLMDEKSVPESDRFTVVRPAEFYLLLNTGGTSAGLTLNRDYGGMGSYAAASLPMVAGTKLIKSNDLPSTNFTGEAFANVNPGVGTYAQVNNGETYAGNNYNANSGGTTGFVGTKALVLQKGAVGTVKLLDLQSEAEYYAMNQATLLLSKFAMGHGVLRPECVCEITEGRIADADAATYCPNL